MPELRTDRLVLRRWRESGLEPWAAMNADPEVREHLGELLTREQSDAAVALMRAEFDERGLLTHTRARRVVRAADCPGPAPQRSAAARESDTHGRISYLVAARTAFS